MEYLTFFPLGAASMHWDVESSLIITYFSEIKKK